MKIPHNHPKTCLLVVGAILLAWALIWHGSLLPGKHGLQDAGHQKREPAGRVRTGPQGAAAGLAHDGGGERNHAAAPVEDSPPTRAGFGFTASLLEIIRNARPFGHPVLAQGWRPSLLRAKSGNVVRVSLVQCDEFKYRLLRLEEEYPASSVGLRKPISVIISVADHVLVRRDPEKSEEDFERQILAEGWKIRRRMPVSGIYLIDLQQLSPEAMPLALERLRAAPGAVAEAQPDFLVTGTAAPNDPDFNKTWGLANDGQTNGSPGSDIRARQAWDVQQGSRNVRVGVIDSGVDYTHPDLVDNIWANPGELGSGKETNGLDDDANGLIDDWRGWDFANDDNNPMDDHFHGTHCAGTIAASGNNGKGLSGVCWQASIVPIKLLKPAINPSGTATGNATVAPLSDALDAIAYSRVLGLDITSNSWGGLMNVGNMDFLPLLRSEIEQASNAGQLFVAAAGNDSHDNDASELRAFPASLDLPNIISVAATDHRDALAPFSNFGAIRVHLGAPGVRIFSTFPVIRTASMEKCDLPASYGTISGTSMACPHVAGVAALLKASYPAANAAVLKQRILDNVDSIPALTGKVVTGGRLNAEAALIGTIGTSRVAFKSWRPAETAATLNNIINPGEIWGFRVYAENRGSETAYSVIGSLSTISPYINVTQAISSFGDLGPKQSRQGTTVYSITVSPSTPTPHSAELVFTFTDSLGQTRQSRNIVNVQTMSTVGGTVTDFATGLPIVGATVFALGPRDSGPVRTGVDGGYTLPLVDGVSEVTAKAGGYFDNTATITAPAGAGNPPINRELPLKWVKPAVVPPSLAASLSGSGTASQQFSITADGCAPLEWTVWTNATEYAMDSSADAGGPAFAWNDIASTGTVIPPGQWAVALPLGFNFPYFGRNYENIHVSPHGYATLTPEPNLYPGEEQNTLLPSENAPGINSEVIAWLWDAFQPDQTSSIHIARPDSSTFVIQYKQMPFRASPNNKATCQAVLKADGSIVFHYLTAGVTNHGTVGIQDATRTKGVRAVFNQSYLSDNFSVRFRPLGASPWLSLNLGSGTTAASASATVTATFISAGLPVGTHSASIIVDSNSPSFPRLLVPVSLTTSSGIPVPEPPQWVKASDAGEFSDRVRVAWAASIGATSYEIQRRTYPSGTFSTLTTVTATTFDDLTATTRQTYAYQVIARNATGASTASAFEVGIAGSLLDSARLGVHPFGKIIYSGGQVSAILINWYENLPELPGGSRLEFSTDGGDVFTTLAEWPTGAPTHFLHAGYPFMPGSAYLYRFSPDGASSFAVDQFIIIPGPATGPAPGHAVEGYAWAAGAFGEENMGNPALVGDDADPDGDGITNLLEYAIGSPPTVAGSDKLPKVTLEKDPRAGVNLTSSFPLDPLQVPPRYLTMDVTKNPDAVNLDYSVEFSTDLVDWNSGEGFTTTIYDQPDRMKVRSAIPANAIPKQFLRLKVGH